jgi:hypothetical protein
VLVGGNLRHRGTHGLKHGVSHCGPHPVHGVGDTSVYWVDYQGDGGEANHTRDEFQARSGVGWTETTECKSREPHEPVDAEARDHH